MAESYSQRFKSLARFFGANDPVDFETHTRRVDDTMEHAGRVLHGLVCDNHGLLNWPDSLKQKPVSEKREPDWPKGRFCWAEYWMAAVAWLADNHPSSGVGLSGLALEVCRFPEEWYGHDPLQRYMDFRGIPEVIDAAAEFYGVLATHSVAACQRFADLAERAASQTQVADGTDKPPYDSTSTTDNGGGGKDEPAHCCECLTADGAARLTIEAYNRLTVMPKDKLILDLTGIHSNSVRVYTELSGGWQTLRAGGAKMVAHLMKHPREALSETQLREVAPSVNEVRETWRKTIPVFDEVYSWFSDGRNGEFTFTPKKRPYALLSPLPQTDASETPKS